MRKKILVTGGAGFIGSNLSEKLLASPDVEVVRIIDNLATGFRENISHLLPNKKFEFIEEDIRDFSSCKRASEGMDIILHQAALGSVPRSILDPVNTNAFNVSGTLNIFTAAKENGVRHLAFASSSSTYGNNLDLPKVEEKTGDPLSPYAVTKKVGELYAKVFSDLYDFHFIGFRYFNVFGPRQSPKGAYAAVIPIFFREMMAGRSPVINGNGEQSRDFTYVENVVDANILTLTSENKESWNQIYNIAYGDKTSLNQLFRRISELVKFTGEPVHGPDRQGDIRDSLANIEKAKLLLHYHPRFSIQEGLTRTFEWYRAHPEVLG